MNLNDSKLSMIVHALTEVVTILKKLKQDQIAMKIELIREEILNAIEEK